MEATTIEKDESKPSPHPGLDAAKTVAVAAPEPDKEGKLGPKDTSDVLDATAWLLEAFDERDEPVEKTLQLNVGSSTNPKWMPWVIKAVEGPQLRAIRARAADEMSERGRRGNAAQRNSILDDSNTAARANAEIVLAGTVVPDLKATAQMRQLADATILVEEAFKRKPGLVDQVSTEIMELSGYDDEAVRDDMEVAAAGNSPG